jgi:3alpha(or 20beta)-hydroxysteroid dehydrogenase
MAGRLQGKTALITGASRGQGEAEARLFASEGAMVYLADVLDDAGEEVAASIRTSGGSAKYMHLDVTSEQGWASLVGLIEANHDQVDVLVNNAGIIGRGGITTTSLADWKRVFDINVNGAFLGVAAVAPAMKRARCGSIINVGSVAGLSGYPAASYSASKWALRGLSKTASLELAGWGIRVNAIHPGLVDTPMVTMELHNRLVTELTPIGRSAKPSEIASLALFLASDESGYITGEDIAIDGGLTNGAGLRNVALATGAFEDPAQTA